MCSVLSWVDPFSSQHPTFASFKNDETLSTTKKVGIFVASVFVGAFTFGFGGLALFRYLAGRFSTKPPANQSWEATASTDDTAKKSLSKAPGGEGMTSPSSNVNAVFRPKCSESAPLVPKADLSNDDEDLPLGKPADYEKIRTKIFATQKSQKAPLASTKKASEILPGLFWGKGTDSLPGPQNSCDFAVRASRIEGKQPGFSVGACFIPNEDHKSSVGPGSFSEYVLTSTVEDIAKNIEDGKTVFVCCQEGNKRSALVVLAYLMTRYQVSQEAALSFLKVQRNIEEGDFAPYSSKLDYLNDRVVAEH